VVTGVQQWFSRGHKEDCYAIFDHRSVDPHRVTKYRSRGKSELTSALSANRVGQQSFEHRQGMSGPCPVSNFGNAVGPEIQYSGQPTATLLPSLAGTPGVNRKSNGDGKMKTYRALTALVIASSGCVTTQPAAAADQEFICDLTRWDYDKNGDRIGGETLKYSLVINLSDGLAHGPIDGQISAKGTNAKSTFWKAAYGADRTTYCDVGGSESLHRSYCQCRPVDAGGVCPMCGNGSLDRLTGQFYGEMWSVPCTESARRAKDFIRRTGGGLEDGSKVAAGQVEEWQGVCKRVESPDARGQ
jgi:hypothetical protein